MRETTMTSNKLTATQAEEHLRRGWCSRVSSGGTDFFYDDRAGQRLRFRENHAGLESWDCGLPSSGTYTPHYNTLTTAQAEEYLMASPWHRVVLPDGTAAVSANIPRYWANDEFHRGELGDDCSMWLSWPSYAITDNEPPTPGTRLTASQAEQYLREGEERRVKRVEYGSTWRCIDGTFYFKSCVTGLEWSNRIVANLSGLGTFTVAPDEEPQREQLNVATFAISANDSTLDFFYIRDESGHCRTEKYYPEWQLDAVAEEAQRQRERADKAEWELGRARFANSTLRNRVSMAREALNG